MNGETKEATAIACSSKSSPAFSKRDITDSGSGPPFDADSTSLVADPLGLCPFGVKSTRMGKVNVGQSKEDSSPGTVDELVRSRYEISDLLDNWEMPDAASKPELVKSGEKHLNSSNVMAENESSLSTVNATLPVNADISTVTVSPSMDKLPGSAEILPVPKFEQVTAAMPSRESFVENVKCEVPRPANINRAGELSYESTGRSIATNSAVEGQKLSSIKPLNASQGLDTPGKVSNFGKATDTAAGQRKPASDVSKPMANVSIHFSKKTAYEDSDEDEGMGIAISVTSVPNKEATASEQSSSLESVAEPFIDILPSVESETPQSNRVVPEINDVCSTPKTVSGDTSQASESKVAKPSSDRKRKGWYSMLSATYKSRSIEYKRIFKDIPSSERLMVDYSCALQKDILCHGRMYVSRDWVCFYANIFSWETSVVVRTKDIAKLTKEKTARVIPNAIQICTSDDKTYFFASLASRDKTFLVLDRLRKCAIDDQPMSLQELWQWVHYSYGEDLGLSDGDDDYISLSSEEKIDFQTQVQQKLNEQCGDGLSSAGSTADLGSLESVADLESSVSESIPANGAKQKLFKNSPEKSVPKVGLENPNVDVKGEVDPGSESDAEDSSESQKSDEKQSSFDACSAHEHFEIPAVDENYDIPVDTLFQHLFTDSPVFRNFLNNRKTFDVVLTPWPSEADSNGMKVRNISYTLSLTNALGPKTSPSTERQIMHCQSQPGEFYLVDAEVINGKIPYGEDFYVMSRYCLSRVTNARCRLRITSQIKYRKNVWGFVRNIIDKNVTAGIMEAFTALADVLKQECSQSVPTRKQDRRCQLSAGKATVPLSATAATVAAVVRGKEEARPLITSDSLTRILFFGLILLMMFNTFLLFKLWSVESRLYEERFPRSRVTNGQSTGANVDTVQVLEGIASLLSELRETLLSHNKLYMKESVVCDQDKCT